MTRQFFTADTHFYHTAALRWRPFSSIHEMNEEMIERWNRVVEPGDVVYHLGDVGFWPSIYEAADTLMRLNGSIHLVLGNHDDSLIAFHKRWTKDPEDRSPLVTVAHMAYIRVRLNSAEQAQKAMLCHYPLVTWRNSHHGAWHLHGHSHGNLDELRLPEAKRLDVGVDPWDFRPVSVEEIARAMEIRTVDRVDHHDPAKGGF